MGFTKSDRIKFLAKCDETRNIMPTVVIERQQTLFDEVIESTPNRKWQHLSLHFKYPPLDNNPNGDPIPKQSARFTAKRHLKDDNYGNKKGDVIVYTNKQGKKDVLITSYPETKLVNTANMIKEQIKMQLAKKYPYFAKYRKGVFITRLEMIFKVSNSAPKYMVDDIKNGTKIYFKETAPDCDNLEKLIYDCLEDVGIMDNDGQICSKNGILKRYGIVPGVIIEMEGEI